MNEIIICFVSILVILYIGKWLWGIIRTEDDTVEATNPFDILYYHSLKLNNEETQTVVKEQEGYYYISIVSGDVCGAFDYARGYTSLSLMALSLELSTKELKNIMFKYGAEIRKFKKDDGGYIKRICFVKESQIHDFTDYCNAIKIMKKLMQ